MKKLIAFIVLLVGGGVGWWYWVKYGTPPEPATISKQTISRGNIVEAVKSTGALEPTRRYDIGSQVSGIVKAIYVDMNDIVKKDQLMAEIDPSLLQVQVDIQEANVQRAESDIANQEVQLQDQIVQFGRTKSLYERSLINLQAFETAELAIKTRQSQIASARKGLVSSKAQLASAQLNVSYTKIKAPADGVVVTRSVDVGQTVQASMQSPSFFIMNEPLDKLKLTANVDEAEIGKIRKGMEVRFTVDSYGQEPFYGTVEAVRLGATNQNNVVTYPVWITVPNPQLKLRPFMTATLSIIVSQVNDVVRVPISATRFRPTSDMYKALGLTPPTPGQGGRLGGAGETSNNPPAGGNRGGQNAQATTPGQTPAPGGGQTRTGQAPNAPNAPNGQQASAGNQGRGGGGSNRQAGQAGQSGQQAGQNRTAGRGGGMGSDFAKMTPEQQKAFMDRFARGGTAGGRGGGGTGGRGQNAGGRGGGQGGRGGNQGGRGGNAQAGPAVDLNSATRIDELWAEVIPVETRGSVWKYNPTAPIEERLKQFQVRLGVSDGSFMELLSGDVKVGDEVLTGIILPASMRPAATNPLMQGNQPRPGGQGMPGMGGGGMPSGGGGGAGGGGGGRGGGGGGRGGN